MDMRRERRSEVVVPGERIGGAGWGQGHPQTEITKASNIVKLSGQSKHILAMKTDHVALSVLTHFSFYEVGTPIY